MKNVRLLIEYEGTNYSGWQIQSTLPTIQGTIEESIALLTGKKVKLFGASRTDAGVHAFGQVANFHIDSVVEPASFAGALNLTLPLDIVIKESTEAESGFHSSMHAKEKHYLYRIERRRYRTAISRNFAWHYFQPLDVELMREGTKRFIGKKDFSSFMADGSRVKTTEKNITSFEVKEEGDFLELHIRGDAFLRHMVRIMVGTLTTLGKGKLTLDDIDRIFEAGVRREAAQTAPASGLHLVEVFY
ncbi:MAG: tRNA pseudouridine(38-40) synthase TruA [Proteobacteria bacterium]|nr:tRNA pseudouridine(38-40) synthase TruA [Pseudomonadota bacterium]